MECHCRGGHIQGHEGKGDEVKIKAELYNDNFQNFKRYNIPKAQLVVADIPYNLKGEAK